MLFLLELYSFTELVSFQICKIHFFLLLSSPRPVAMCHGKLHVVARMLDANCLVSADNVAEVDVATKKPKLISSYYSFSMKNCQFEYFCLARAFFPLLLTFLTFLTCVKQLPVFSAHSKSCSVLI